MVNDLITTEKARSNTNVRFDEHFQRQQRSTRQGRNTLARLENH